MVISEGETGTLASGDPLFVNPCMLLSLVGVHWGSK